MNRSSELGPEWNLALDLISFLPLDARPGVGLAFLALKE